MTKEKMIVARRLHTAAIEVRPLAGQRIRNRYHDAAAREFAPLGRDDPERQELAASSPAFGSVFGSEPSA